jgi:hypothetical protein
MAMPDYYFSGISSYQQLKLLSELNVCGMVNALHARQPRMKKAYRDFPRLRLALDSGAFQGRMTLGRYEDTLRAVGHRFEWKANLDVMGDQRKSHRNWLWLRARGHDVRYVFQIEGGLQVRDVLPDIKDEKVIGLGGLVPLMKDPVAAVELIRAYGEVFAASGMQLHLFGVSSFLVTRFVGGEPWCASVDAQGWLAAGKNHRTWDRFGRYEHRPDLTRDECMRLNIMWARAWFERLDKPLWREVADLASDDCAYWEYVNLAERFGIEDETELLTYWDFLGAAEAEARARDEETSCTACGCNRASVVDEGPMPEEGEEWMCPECQIREWYAAHPEYAPKAIILFRRAADLYPPEPEPESDMNPYYYYSTDPNQLDLFAPASQLDLFAQTPEAVCLSSN